MHRLRFLLFALAFLARPAFAADAIDRTIDRMSDDEKIAQLLMVGFDGTRVSPDLRMLVSQWHAGGIVLYRQNIQSARQAAQRNAEIRALAAGNVEPFIAVDQEGGLVQRLRDGVPELPGNMALGATRSPRLARRAGRALAQSLRALGFTMNFAPVLDVLWNPENTVFLTRSFSDDPHLAARLGRAFVRGANEGGIISVAKHFPGEGGTAGDSHFALPVLDSDRNAMDSCELVPFRAAIAAHLPALMTGHIAVPRIAEEPGLPATISRRVLTDLLRHDLRFNGLVITDELQMPSIRSRASVGDLAVEAILAGADMIMVVWDHHDRDEIYDALRRAYASGELPRATVRRSLRRILILKRRLKIQRRTSDDRSIANEIATRSVALARRDSGPLYDAGRSVVMLGSDGPLRRQFPAATIIEPPRRLDPTTFDATIDSAVIACRGATTLIAVIGSDNDKRLARALRKRLPLIRFIVVALGSPFEVRDIPKPDAILFTWSSGWPSQEAAARVLRGRAKARGRIPVEISLP
ncbi:MAG TPA: glycoside hydrolase family 3 N-terminal domain-containing protein [Thermoanaerobaculia bacterium]|nr:glycoside hydrolase family 3 N-terminal domain-containing protein [Thermoanaerobaculia bacterium]